MDIWKYVRTLDLDKCAEQFQHALPFPSICIDDFLNDSFAEKVAAAFPSYDEAQQLGRGFHAVNERGKVQVTDPDQFTGAVRTLHDLLASHEFLQLVSKVTGINDLRADGELVGGGMHQTGPRGHLDVHIDFNYITERSLHRRLNILIFFNRDWREEWGGSLELWDQTVQTCHHSMLPIFNRCVIFETSDVSFHGVTAVTCPPTESRQSFAAYYYTHETRVGFENDSHTTIFRARPDERWKRWVAMPLERFGRSISDGKQRIKSAVKRVVRPS